MICLNQVFNCYNLEITCLFYREYLEFITQVYMLKLQVKEILPSVRSLKRVIYESKIKSTYNL